MIISRFGTIRAPTFWTSINIFNRVIPNSSNVYRNIATTTAAEDEQKLKLKATAARVQLRALPQSSRPLRPLSAYILFLLDARQGFIDELGGGRPSIVQIAKLAGKKWKELDENEREKYLARASKLRQEYLESKAKYLQKRSSTDLVIEQYRGRLQKTLNMTPDQRKFPDPNAPAKPLNSYLLYAKEVWAMNGEEQSKIFGKSFKDIPVLEAAKLMGKGWKSMSESEKEKYTSILKRTRAEYVETKKKYDKSLEEARKQVAESLKEAVNKSPSVGRRKRKIRKATASPNSSKKRSPLTKKKATLRRSGTKKATLKRTGAKKATLKRTGTKKATLKRTGTKKQATKNKKLAQTKKRKVAKK